MPLSAQSQIPAPTPPLRVFSHENKALMEALKAALLPFVGPGEWLIWRAPFRWHNESGALANHFECLSLDDLCGEFGYEVVHDFQHLAIVKPPTR